MKASDILIYMYALLNSLSTSVYTPMQQHDTYQHLLQIFGLYLELSGEEPECQKKKRCWVRPIFQHHKRISQGASDKLVFEMEANDKEMYCKYLRMNSFLFKQLLLKVKPFIEKQRAVREPIPAHTRLQICLRYLASGDSMTSISFAFRVAPNTVSSIVKETCLAIWLSLKDLSFPRLTSEKWHDIAHHYEEKWNFRHCFGAVDGKQVLIQAPPNTGSTYYNYKNDFSINLMAIVDAHYRFVAIDIGAPGRRSDGGVFRESKIGRRFERKCLNVPEADAVNIEGPVLPYVLVGDEAFPLSFFLMRPYPRSGSLNRRKKIFNYRLSRARRMVESAFGILGARWRIYRTEIIGSPELATRIVQATTCLHNWIITNDLKRQGTSERTRLYTHLTQAERTLPINAFQDHQPQEENVHFVQNQSNPIEIREKFAEYFNSENGAVEWQFDKVLNNDL